jgi:hypothetical protein
MNTTLNRDEQPTLRKTAAIMNRVADSAIEPAALIGATRRVSDVV